MTARITTLNDRFGVRILEKISERSKKAIERYTREEFLHKMNKLVKNGGYGVVNQRIEHSQYSRLKWEVVSNDNANGFSIGFKNNARARFTDTNYVPWLYTGKHHNNFPNGYIASDTQGLTKEKVIEMKSKYKDGCINAVASSLKNVKNIKAKKGKL